MSHKSQLAVLIIFFSLIISACKGDSQLSLQDAELYDVSPVLREFYLRMGGREVLGPVISPPKDSDGTIRQFVMAGEMVFDPNAPSKERFQLAPLGRELGIGKSSDAHLEVADPFKAVFNKLFGEPFAGKPMTGLIYNRESERFEQYFENVGFYSGPETNGAVRLLPYGAWKCGEDCRSSLPQNAAPLLHLPTTDSSNTLTATVETPGAQLTVEPVQDTPLSTVQPSEKRSNLAQSPSLLLPLVLKSNLPALSEKQAVDGSIDPKITSAMAYPEPGQSPRRWFLTMRKEYDRLTVKQSQQISVEIKLDGMPYEGAQVILLVQMPDGTTLETSFPATNAQGTASLELEPIQTKNGTEIRFAVCLSGDSNNQYCQQDSFTIVKKRK